mmetsp:Transcript_90764/g.236441  ORF Transcript_90764/g.236441 Transcript_90764/m.236441 type:complete len:320 (-) Transcript_90764:462-1421(-)
MRSICHAAKGVRRCRTRDAVLSLALQSAPRRQPHRARSNALHGAPADWHAEDGGVGARVGLREQHLRPRRPVGAGVDHGRLALRADATRWRVGRGLRRCRAGRARAQLVGGGVLHLPVLLRDLRHLPLQHQSLLAQLHPLGAQLAELAALGLDGRHHEAAVLLRLALLLDVVLQARLLGLLLGGDLGQGTLDVADGRRVGLHGGELLAARREGLAPRREVREHLQVVLGAAYLDPEVAQLVHQVRQAARGRRRVLLHLPARVVQTVHPRAHLVQVTLSLVPLRHLVVQLPASLDQLIRQSVELGICAARGVHHPRHRLL